MSETDAPREESATTGPMYFARVTVENVRCFGSRELLDLCDGSGRPAKWTVILGDNGIGKTTLLQCIHAMKPTVLPPMPGAAVGTVPDFTYLPSSLKQELLRNSSSEGSELTAEVFRGRAFVDPRGSHEVLPLFAKWNARESSSSQYFELNADMFCCGYGAARRPGRTLLSADSRAGAAAATLFSDSAELINVEGWLLQADYSARSSAPGAQQRFENIRATILRLLENVSDIRIEGLDKVPPQPIVQFATPYGWVRPHQLSLGYRAMLGWVLDLASRMFERYPESEDPLSEPAVVLVDEIDLHLHPRWQRAIVKFLNERFRQTQFIVTAHSPLIVQAAENANLVVLHVAPTGDRVLIENDPEIVRGWRVDQLLTSDLFGLTSARPPGFTRMLERRGELLDKASRTPDEEKELADIERELQSIPVGETPEDIEANKTLRWFAEQLRKDMARS